METNSGNHWEEGSSMNETMPGRRISKDFIQGCVRYDARRGEYFRVNYELVEGRWEGFVSLATIEDYVQEKCERAPWN
jgi:hypothetical protein